MGAKHLVADFEECVKFMVYRIVCQEENQNDIFSYAFGKLENMRKCKRTERYIVLRETLLGVPALQLQL